jgi:hypothetical protein
MILRSLAFFIILHACHLPHFLTASTRLRIAYLILGLRGSEADLPNRILLLILVLSSMQLGYDIDVGFV